MSVPSDKLQIYNPIVATGVVICTILGGCGVVDKHNAKMDKEIASHHDKLKVLSSKHIDDCLLFFKTKHPEFEFFSTPTFSQGATRLSVMDHVNKRAGARPVLSFFSNTNKKIWVSTFQMRANALCKYVVENNELVFYHGCLTSNTWCQ